MHKYDYFIFLYLQIFDIIHLTHFINGFSNSIHSLILYLSRRLQTDYFNIHILNRESFLFVSVNHIQPKLLLLLQNYTHRNYV